MALAVMLTALFALASMMQAVVRSDPVMLARTLLVAIPLAMCLMFVAVTLAGGAVAVTDWMSASVMDAFDRDVSRAFKDLADLFSGQPGGKALASFLVFLGALLVALLGLLVWIELAIREGAIYVALGFMPLAFAAMVWERTAVWCRRLTDTLTVLILSKFGIVWGLVMSASILGNAGGDLSTLTAGIAVLLISALVPAALFALIPFLDGEPSGWSRSHVGGAVRAAPGAVTATTMVRGQMVRSFGSGAPSRAAGLKPASTPTDPASKGSGPRPPRAGSSIDVPKASPPPPAKPEQPKDKVS